MTELRRLQHITQEAWRRRGPIVEAHVGDLAWWSREPGYRAQVWSERGWAWLIAPAEVDLLTVERDHALLAEMLDWFEAEAEAGDELEVWSLEDDAARIEELRRRGYQPVTAPSFLHMLRGLDELPEPPLSPGYSPQPADPRRLVAAQRAAFSASTLTERSTSASGERGRTGRSSTSPSKRRTDPARRSAARRREPRGGARAGGETHPDHARRGLARAACLAGLHALRDHGATCALVYARGDDACPAPRALYASLGFEPAGRHHRYVRPPKHRPTGCGSHRPPRTGDARTTPTRP